MTSHISAAVYLRIFLDSSLDDISMRLKFSSVSHLMIGGIISGVSRGAPVYLRHIAVIPVPPGKSVSHIKFPIES